MRPLPSTINGVQDEIAQAETDFSLGREVREAHLQATENPFGLESELRDLRRELAISEDNLASAEREVSQQEQGLNGQADDINKLEEENERLKKHVAKLERQLERAS